MTEPVPSGDALIGYVGYDLMIERLREKYPDVPVARIERIAWAEYEAISGGRPLVVPAAVEEGTMERLGERYATHGRQSIAG